MYGYIYITTNILTNKKYIGKRKYVSEKADAKYVGSGVIVSKYKKKHGRDIFSKEIIEWCETEDKLAEREIYWISYYDAVKSDDFYNIHEGGKGGNTLAGYTDEQRKSHRKKVSEHHADMSGEKNPHYGVKVPDEQKKRQSEKMKGHIPWNKGISTGPCSEEHKEKTRKTCLAKREVFGESHKGKTIMNNGVKQIQVNPDEVALYEADGFVKGVLRNGGGWNKGMTGAKKWLKNVQTGESKQVKLEEVDMYISNGWEFGRILK